MSHSQNMFVKQLCIKWLLMQVILVTVTINLSAASPGTVDRIFGLLGKATVDMGGTNDRSFASALQSDGKIILVGATTINGNTDFAVTKLNADGGLDLNFGANGKVLTDFNGEFEQAHTVVIQPDGKIIVAGSGNQWETATGLKLARYNTDGSLDISFGASGKVNMQVAGQNVNLPTMVLQPDGKILVAAMRADHRLVLLRFNSDGSQDNSFNNSNSQAIQQSWVWNPASLALQSDGKIIVAATVNYTFGVFRFGNDGILDNSFGQGGFVSTSFTYQGNNASGASPNAIAVQPDGKILVAGYFSGGAEQTPTLVRYLPNGNLDPNFAPNLTREITDGCFCTANIEQILLSPDGKFYLAGRPWASLSRYLDDGTPDRSFGFRGTRRFVYRDNLELTNALLLNDGKILISGTHSSTSNQNQYDFVAERIQVNQTRATTRADFDGDGKTDFSVYRSEFLNPQPHGWRVLSSRNNTLLRPPLTVVPQVLVPNDYDDDRITDAAGYSSGVWSIAASSSGNEGFGRQLGVAGDIPISADYDGDGYADHAVYRPNLGRWLIMFSQKSAVIRTDRFDFGLETDKPVPADYDGDGRTDIAVFRPTNGVWYIWQSSSESLLSIQWGIGSDKLVPADYDGDGKADIAIVRDGNWYILRSSDNSFFAVNWGFNTDKPVPGDYDGDSKTDIAVYRDGNWYVLKSSDSSLLAVQWGVSNDIPIPFTYLP